MPSGLFGRSIPNQMNDAIHEEVQNGAQEQCRSLMYLVADFLNQQGLFKTCDTLTDEAQLSSNYQICDNIDLQIILNEYTDHYHSRFQKWPQICKQVKNSLPKDASDLTKACCQKDNSPKLKPKDFDKLEQSLPVDPGLTVTPLSQKDAISSGPSDNISPLIDGKRVLRPVGDLYPVGSEFKAIAEFITQEIITTNVNVHWDDVYGLAECKMLLKEAIIYPTKYPQHFDSAFTPWKGILLYGPPGTGKTMLAKVIATECDLTFFNITASSLVSKWRGDTEKYVRMLFELASYHAPSIIFIDEIEWIAADDGVCGSDRSETVSRFRAELLARLDSLMSENASHVILLAATNVPWCLDTALLRHLETHIHVGVPDSNVRKEILKVYTEEALHNSREFCSVVQRTDGYSIVDLKRLCKEAWMRQMRPFWSRLENVQSNRRTVLLDMPKLVTCASWLLQSVDHILSTAKPLKGRYEQWKFSMTR